MFPTDDQGLAVLAGLAATQFDLPVALVSLLDKDGSRLVAASGAGTECDAFGSGDPFHDATLRQPGYPLLVDDALADPRFAASRLLLRPSWIGCYAGMPLLGQAGLPIGILGVLGPARRRFTPFDSALLRQLARVACTLTERRRYGRSGNIARLRQAPDKQWPTPACTPSDIDWLDLVHPMQRDAVASRWRQAFDRKIPFSEEFKAREDDGLTRWFRIDMQPPDGDGDPHPSRSDGSGLPWPGSLQLVDQLLDVEPAARDPATVDLVTDLVNRQRFLVLLERAIGDATLGIPFALLCLDVEDFKLVNETLGHKAGDRILQEIAARLVSCVRHGDVVGRHYGNTFLVIQSAVNRPVDVHSLGQRIINRLREPLLIDGQPVDVAVSIGAALGPRDGMNGESLLRHADLALRRARQDGGGMLRLFDPTMDAVAIQRRWLHRDLRHALERDELLLQFQPILSLRTGQTVCMEALLRWQHAVRGPVSPAEFIPVAESTGLIMPIGAWVLRQACKTALLWPSTVRVSVNLSPRQFSGCDIVTLVSHVLAETALAPDRLELEITETLPLLDNPRNAQILIELRALGVRLSLDDFGIGYSSLAYLGHFRFDSIKLDRQFVTAMSQPEGLAIARAIIGLAASLGSSVTAEGIETTGQLELVIDEGCDDAQGYWIARPVEADRVVATLDSVRSRFSGRGDRR